MSLANFKVYNMASEFLRVGLGLMETLPTGSYTFCDQFKRAALSIVLNIAEGAGKYSKREQVRFYNISRGSAFECYAVLDVCRNLRLLEEDQVLPVHAKLNSIIAILTKLCGKRL